MPLIISDLIRRQATVTVQVQVEPGVTEPLRLTYLCNVINLDMEQRFLTARTGPEVAAILAEIVRDWDLTDQVPVTDAKGKPRKGADGEPLTETVPFPPTPENLRRLPTSMLVAILTAIRSGARVGEASAGGSGAGS